MPSAHRLESTPVNFLATSSLWRSLRHRNYRLYLTGQLVSVCGTWMQQVALSWLVYRLTGSATLLGVVGFASQIPIFVLGPVGGVISDRYSCHRVAVWSQCAALTQALLLALLTLMGWIQPGHIIVLGVALGLVYAFDMPARQALVHQLVETDDLANAVALNSSMINSARIVGPALAGIVVAKFGEGICFLINAISYVAVILALLAMKLPQRPATLVKAISIAASLREGLRYTLDTTPIRDLLILLGVVGFMGMPYMTLMPVFAANVHKSGADALGLMYGAVGLGRRHRRALSRPAEKYHRYRPGHCGCYSALWTWTHRLHGLAPILAYLVDFGRRGLRLDGADRGLQHRAANSRRQSHARPRDESFLHDARRHGALWQPARGMGRRSDRRASGDRRRRRFLRLSGNYFCAPVAAAARSRETDLDCPRDHCRSDP